MGLRHIVLFRFEESVGREDRARAVSELQALELAIPEIDALVVSESCSSNPAGYSLVLEADFADGEAYSRYSTADAHQRVWTTVLEPITVELASIQRPLDPPTTRVAADIDDDFT